MFFVVSHVFMLVAVVCGMKFAFVQRAGSFDADVAL